MREVGAFEAKNKRSRLLDLVGHGEEIIITPHSKAVAALRRRTKPSTAS